LNIQAADFYELAELPATTIDTIITRHVAIRPESPAIVVSKNDILTYRALGAQVKAFGAALHINGIGRSAKVAVMLPDGPELAVALLATACHAVAVPLNPKLAAVELDNLFATLSLDALITSESIASLARGLASRHGIRQLELNNGDAHTFKISVAPAVKSGAHETAKLPRRSANPDDMALILRTSATAGRSKLVPVTHRNLMIAAERRKLWFGLTPDDRALSFKPLYYAAGLKSLLICLLLGASVALPERKADADIVDWLVDLQPTWYHGGQTFFMDVLERVQKRQGMPLRHRLRFIRAGGAPLSATVRQRIEEVFGVPVLEAYGLSEAGIVATNPIAPERRKSGTVGKPWPNEVAIRAEDGQWLPPGATGEIFVRGPGIMPGYLDDDEANRAAFVDGWFRTGDLGSLDTEGFLIVVGRLKELINRGGEKISPYEIECALLLHPSVREAVAFSVPHPRLGENVAAAVVLTPGANVTPKDISVFLCNHLAPFKIPQHIFVKPELPKGATGKSLRRLLSEEAAHYVPSVVPAWSPLQIQILEIWERLLGRNNIGIDDNFFEAGGDSLLATQMLCEVEAITRQQILASELRAAYTIRELETAILRGSPPTAKLLTCAKEGFGTPFFFCHGDFQGRGFYALKLADMLTCNHPVFLLHPYPNPAPKLTIEEMAREYVPLIQSVQPNGPVRLGGYCNSGLLAWEIACQLTRLGRDIEFVLLIDTGSLNARHTLRVIARVIRVVVAVAPKRISDKFERDGMSSLWSRGWRRYPITPYSQALRNYIPPKLQTRLICMVSEESRRTKANAYSTAPWNNICSEVHCENIPGTHLGCLTTNVGDLARVLDGFLNRPH
jgi:acyl-CoA synthetase (AMP-forming)/AMP-acid ligase II/thioesterase domain-containing protein